ncbi:zinc finger, CCHC-type containing protein [Tanacetum coccineum]|uniref:Zinc finger, CCHC-type containing protein n=1 Tax=Tanacetum coccineum TaxID=301880 RepID=A0ABQ5HLU0_9ASTR
MARCMMKARGIPNYFWGKAVRHATYIINRTPTRALVGVTPYEKFYGEKPNLEDLKVFRCVAYERIVSKHLKKLNDRSKPLVYLGKKPSSGSFWLYNSRENKIIISAYVVFDEKKGWIWKAENSNQERREPGTSIVLWDKKNRETEQIWNNDATIHDVIIHVTVNTVHNPVTVHETPFHVTSLEGDEDEYENDVTPIPEPMNYNEAKLNLKWIKAMKTKLESIVKNNTWKLVPLPKGFVPIGLSNPNFSSFKDVY